MEGIPSKRGRSGFDTIDGQDTAKAKILAWLRTFAEGTIWIFTWDDVESELKKITGVSHHDHLWKRPIYQIINKQYQIGWVVEYDDELLWQRWDPRREKKPRPTGRFRLTTPDERAMLRERNKLWKQVKAGEISRITTEDEGRVIRLGENTRLRRERDQARADLRMILEGLHRLLSRLLD